MAEPDDKDAYSEEESQRRFEALLRAALNTKPKPMKDVPGKRAQPKSSDDEK